MTGIDLKIQQTSTSTLLWKEATLQRKHKWYDLHIDEHNTTIYLFQTMHSDTRQFHTVSVGLFTFAISQSLCNGTWQMFMNIHSVSCILRKYTWLTSKDNTFN